MNNFEKIKQAEINELANFIRTNKKINFSCINCDYRDEDFCTFYECEQEIVKWLLQEVEE